MPQLMVAENHGKTQPYRILLVEAKPNRSLERRQQVEQFFAAVLTQYLQKRDRLSMQILIETVLGTSYVQSATKVSINGLLRSSVSMSMRQVKEKGEFSVRFKELHKVLVLQKK